MAIRLDLKLNHVTEIKSLVKRIKGIDITGYKDDFLLRRVRARMLALGINSIESYIRYLRNNPSEIDKLLDALSINVSEFFRDPWVWDKVRKILEQLISSKNIVRIWSAGCSRGEEPYTISIIVNEILSNKKGFKKVTIYATDIDKEAIKEAMEGVYSISALKNVPKHLLYKYFEKVGLTKYRVKDIVKSIVKFKHHDLIKDPPLLFMDMIFCRNVLIYFNKELQSKVIKKFHRSLNSRGYLVLGISEYLPEDLRGLFEVYDLKSRIFRKLS